MQITAYISDKTKITATHEGEPYQAIGEYLGKPFNGGYCHAIAIDGIQYNMSTHRYLSKRAHDKNLALLATRAKARLEYSAPRVGDFIIIDGVYLRFTHNWDEKGLQTTCKRLGDATNSGGFHINKDGSCSYSGSLDPIIALDNIQATDELRAASFWFFNEDMASAHNGITVKIPVRVWNFTECKK